MAATPPINLRMTAREYGLLGLLSLLWGGSFLFVGIAVFELPPLTIVAIRVGLASMVLLMAIAFMGIALPRDARAWLLYFLLGLLNNAVPFALIVWAQTQIASGLASILNATTPLFTLLAAHVLTTDEKLSVHRLAGVAVGFGGVAVLLGPELLGSEPPVDFGPYQMVGNFGPYQMVGNFGPYQMVGNFGPGKQAGIGNPHALAQGACLLAALSYGFAGIAARRFGRHGQQPMAMAAGQVTAAAIILLPLALLIDHPWTLALPTPPTLAAVTALAVVSTALAYIIYFRILSSAGAGNLMLCTFLIPVTAIALGMVVLGEQLDPRHFMGFAVIGLGLATIDGRVPAGLARLVPGWARRTGKRGADHG